MAEKTGATPPPETDRLRVPLALSGIVGPAVFWIMLVILAALRPGYSHVADPGSDLGAVGTPNAIFMSVNFVVTGGLLIAFSVGLHRGIGDGEGSKWGPALLAGFGGITVLAAGIFPTNLEDEMAFTSIMHGLTGLIGVAMIIPAPFVLARRLKEVDAWQDLVPYSRGTGAAIIGSLAVFLVLSNSDFAGAAQRVFLGIIFLWIVVLAVRLLRFALSERPSG